MKPAGAHVKHRVVFGDVPEPGDELRFRSGRRYLVLTVRGRALMCEVLASSAPVIGRVLPWQWASRGRR